MTPARWESEMRVSSFSGRLSFSRELVHYHSSTREVLYHSAAWYSKMGTVGGILAVLLAICQPAIGAPPPGFGYPSPWASGGPSWDDAYAKAGDFVGQLTLVEKVNLATGTGWGSGLCIGTTGSVPRLGFRGLCLEDGPGHWEFDTVRTHDYPKAQKTL